MERIDTLLAAMTVEEKIGQLNMVAASRAVTGPGELRDLHEGIRAGRIGCLLNLWGADEVRAVQRLAVEESRLRVPLLVGLDVIHGHRTIFPASLAEACLFAPDLWEKTARAAAEEAAGGRRRPDLRADARRGARPALGAHRREPRRRHLGRLPDGGGQDARLSGAGSRGAGRASPPPPSIFAPMAP